jgi:Ran GTPase-activating protein (RanGAP) involved in mRNA processing and transport
MSDLTACVPDKILFLIISLLPFDKAHLLLRVSKYMKEILTTAKMQITNVDNAHKGGNRNRVKLLLHTISEMPQLTTIDLYNNLTGYCSDALATTLLHLPQLTKLNLGSNYLKLSEKSIIDAIGTLTKLEWLNLGQNNFGSDSGILLHNMLSSLTQLKSLILDSIYLSNTNFTSLIHALNNLPKLESFNIRSNGLNNALPTALYNLSQLTNLNIAYTYCKSKSNTAELLVPVLSKMTKLKSLNLSGNHIKSIGMPGLIPALYHLTLMEELSLSWTNIDIEGISLLGPVLERMPNLTLLDLGINYISPIGASLLAPMLLKLTQLQSLDLKRNTLTTEGALSLVPSLSMMTQLTFLNLEENQICSDGIDAIITAVFNIKKLQTLW